MKTAVKEVKEVKAVEQVETVKIDRRKNNPGRPKSKESMEKDQFMDSLFKKETKFNYLTNNFKIVGNQLYMESYDEALQEQLEFVGVIDKVMPTKFRVQTQTMLGTKAEVVIKLKDIVLAK